jgi:hypothetical protein
MLSHARVQGRDFGTELVGACPAQYQVTGAPDEEVQALNESIMALHGGPSQFCLDELPHDGVDETTELVAIVESARARLRAVIREEHYMLNMAAYQGSVVIAQACAARIEAHVNALSADARNTELQMELDRRPDFNIAVRRLVHEDFFRDARNARRPGHASEMDGRSVAPMTDDT